MPLNCISDDNCYKLKSFQSENKSYVFVKLTDSALNVLQNSFHRNVRSGSIRFENDKGNLCIDDCNFQFSLSSSTEPSLGSFDCLKHQHEKKLLKDLGALSYRLQIHAGDDSYAKTRQKMVDADLAIKSNCTRVLKNSPGCKASHSFVAKSNGAALNSVSRNHSSVKKTTVGHISASEISQPSTNSADIVRVNSGSNRSLNSVKSQSSLAALPNPSCAMSQCSNTCSINDVKDRCHTLSTHKPSLVTRPELSSTASFKFKPDIRHQSLRQRIIYILALRPSKRSDIVQRLFQDGLNEKDQIEIDSVINWAAITPSSSRSSQHYYLKRHLWSQLDESWPFYSKEEHHIFLKNLKMQNQHGVSIARLPTKRGHDSMSELDSHGKEVSQAPSKRFASHINYVSPCTSTGVSDRSSTPDSSPDTADSSNTAISGSTLPDMSQLSHAELCDSDFYSRVCAEYSKIENNEQYLSYKNDFELSYPDYMSCFDILSSIKAKFESYSQSLNQLLPGSIDYQNLSMEIKEQYSRANTTQYQQCRHRYYYLQCKLGYIKSLIRQWQNR